MAASPQPPKTLRAAVAPGRTVVIGMPANFEKGIESTVREEGPGALVELPINEARALIRSGHLVDPDGNVEVLPNGPGPVFNNDTTSMISQG